MHRNVTQKCHTKNSKEKQPTCLPKHHLFQERIRNPHLHQPVPMETILPAETFPPGNKLT